MNDEFMPKRGARGLANLDLFYDDFNEINFYVEDIDQENLYKAIIGKLFTSFKVTRIFPLGGKSAVIAHANSNQMTQSRGYRAYLVDRDFDPLLKREASHPNIYYLDMHCIESHLIEADAILEVIIENKPKIKKEEAADTLKLKECIKEIYQNLRPLFLLYFCIQKLGIQLRNCGIKCEEFCRKEKLWELNPEKVNAYINQILDEAKKQNILPPLVDPLIDYRVEEAFSEESERLVSGKYVMAMLFHYIKSIYPMGPTTFDSFVYRTAKNCSLLSMQSLAERICNQAIKHTKTDLKVA